MLSGESSRSGLFTTPFLSSAYCLNVFRFNRITEFRPEPSGTYGSHVVSDSLPERNSLAGILCLPFFQEASRRIMITTVGCIPVFSGRTYCVSCEGRLEICLFINLPSWISTIAYAICLFASWANRPFISISSS